MNILIDETSKDMASRVDTPVAAPTFALVSFTHEASLAQQLLILLLNHLFLSRSSAIVVTGGGKIPI